MRMGRATGRVGARFVIAAAVAVLARASALWAVDVEELVARATERDLELQKLEIGRTVAGLKVAQSAASRGWKIGIGILNDGFSITGNLATDPANVRFSSDHVAVATAPGPANTSIYLGVPFTWNITAGTFTPTLGVGVTQPLNGLFGARRDREVRVLGERLSLLQADVSAASRRVAVAQSVLAAVRTLVELHLASRDLEEQLLDLADEATRTTALDVEGERGAAFKQVEQKRLSAEEGLRRLEREYGIRKARLEKDLGLSLEDALPTIPEASLRLPGEGGMASSPAVRSAEIDVSLAEARLDQWILTWLPTVTALSTFALTRPSGSESFSAPFTGELSVSWRPLDSGLRALNRQELAEQLALKRLTLEQARRGYLSALADLELDAMGIEDRTADAQRNLELARESVDEMSLLVDKGLKTARDLAKARYAVEKRTIQAQLVALERYAFGYKVRALLPSS